MYILYIYFNVRNIRYVQTFLRHLMRIMIYGFPKNLRQGLKKPSSTKQCEDVNKASVLRELCKTIPQTS